MAETPCNTVQFTVKAARFRDGLAPFRGDNGSIGGVKRWMAGDSPSTPFDTISPQSVTISLEKY